ncbi:2-succinyl-6-hydroxy-2,4-cyclohexadiene-1-carboxylate synthase [Neobacillus sp. DY30]|uniref:2-succinyl-6-hydroxy-2, 4-cyclohexadiene-1-carboxylate synthase n=1 Tax=Neobacillus sp. DY30 TaxID=3047871 RepID=UPI0024C04223|nr:2-succinyl-6-hydroxy-2,4-cyclohexadiene-1-carboxylate synthase [Neobacillus sp. DY30]WHX99698.1 2-succinyl-6-hydroxy-2,4-cyclohexadiene-1-carboxylate synthase [Neobacillus sp. DY30]
MLVKINGLNYYVELCGEGFPLLILHGFTGDSTTWTPFVPIWGKHSKLIIPDIIGHGQTESPNDLNRYEIESAAKDLIMILDHLEIDQIDLLGYSMGGRLALTLAIVYPDRVRKLILESASPGLNSSEERMLRRMKDEELANFINDRGIVSFVDYWEAIPLFSTMCSLPASVKKSIREQRLSNNAIGLANSLLGMGTGSQPSWWRKLDSIRCEVLLLTGDKDGKFCTIAERMAENIESASWIVINDSGHAIHVEQTEKFGTIVSDFLSK